MASKPTTNRGSELVSDWRKCPFCGRWMHARALTCGNYCHWDELVGRVRCTSCRGELVWHPLHGDRCDNCREAA